MSINSWSRTTPYNLKPLCLKPCQSYFHVNKLLTTGPLSVPFYLIVKVVLEKRFTGKHIIHTILLSSDNCSFGLPSVKTKIFWDPFHIPAAGSWLRLQKVKSHLIRTQSLKVLPLKPGVGQYRAMHATLTAGDFFLANFYPSSPFTCIFPKPLPSFSCVSCA